ncbi:reverse transcriptase domain-containing protein [Leclercia adecarboxylata]|uniref:reverse transcriptase domain-containing protein n=1 Tax=Leclercia adecarboxylata TaxID=83655 RepID=UPI0026C307B9
MRNPVSDEVNRPQNEPDNAGQGLLERAFARENLKRAWKRVKANKGAAGVDGLDIDQTAEYLLTQWAGIREQLLSGVYRPSPVRRVVIPKPDGGQRELGIPTVTDRLIQQALLQALQPLLDPTFSEHSYGFRPGRCAQDAVLAAQRYASSGRKVVVDVDLEKFFDRVDHDILMDRLRKRITDQAVIRLIRAYLDAGTLINGVVEKSRCGRRKAAHCRRCWRTCCWTKWIGSLNAEAIVSCAMPTMRTCMCAVRRRGSG